MSIVDSKILFVQEYLVRDLANIVKGYLDPDHIYLGAQVDYIGKKFHLHCTVSSIDISLAGVKVDIDLKVSGIPPPTKSLCVDCLHPCTCGCESSICQ